MYIKNQAKKLISKLYTRTHGLPIDKFTYARDGLYTMNNCDFLSDNSFKKAYAKGKSTGSWNGEDVEWRVHVGCWAADTVKNLDGDFVECGVNKGGLSSAIIDYIRFNELNKRFYLLDTFEGLVNDYISEAEKEKGFDLNIWNYKDCYEEVKATFKDFNVKVIKGSVPDTLPQVDTEKVCFLSLDMNCAYPEVEALKFFWDKIVPGGIVLLDDYGWSHHIEQKKAIDLIATQIGFKILSLPTGQGLILKT